MRGKPRLWPASPIVFGLENEAAEATEATSTAATQPPTITNPTRDPLTPRRDFTIDSPHLRCFQRPAWPVRRTRYRCWEQGPEERTIFRESAMTLATHGRARVSFTGGRRDGSGRRAEVDGDVPA